MSYKAWEGRKFLAKICGLIRVYSICVLLHLGAAAIDAFGTETITLAWDANTDSQTSGYFVYSADSAGNTLGRSNVGVNASATLSDLIDGAKYVFYVTAYDTTGQESEPSNKVMFQAGAPLPPPTVPNKWEETFQDQPVPVVLSGSSTRSTTLTYGVVSGPSHGSLSGAAPYLTYAPALGFIGNDSFSYVANDGWLDSAPGLVSILVKAVNHPPVPTLTNIQTTEDQSMIVTLTATDPDEDALSFTILTGPSHGVISGVAPILSYTPAPNFFGTDSFRYGASDGSLKSQPATVTVTVVPVNDSPVANSRSAQALQNQSVAILLTGDDLDGNSLSFTVLSGPARGGLTGTAPNLTYAPTSNYLGFDSLTFVVNDGAITSAPATISISVVSVNGKVKVRRTVAARP